MNKRVQPDLLSGVADVIEEAEQVAGVVVGTVIDNGHETILIPEAELKLVDAMAEKPTSPFDWATDEVFLTEQPMTAIYLNGVDSIVIRQPNHMRPDEDDIVIVICRQNVHAFIDKLCDLAGIPSAGK